MHMAFLSRVFKNLQWYGMTTKNLETATKTATGIKKSAGIAPGAALYASRLCSQLVRMW